jgi:leucine dehydrogenase
MTELSSINSLKIRDITAVLSGREQDPVIKKNIEFEGHEKVVFAEDKSIGFQAFIAIHNTNRGYALGGCRYWSGYEDIDGDGGLNNAVTDALRLSRGMTYKNSVADLPLGGGKTVIVGKKGTKSPSAETMKALADVLNELNGMYVTAEDVGTSVDYMLIAYGRTSFVAGLPLGTIAAHNLPEDIKSSDIPDADPSPYTAYGTFVGVKAAVKHALKKDSVKGLRISVKGYGHVAETLCDYLHEEGAELIISDIDVSKKEIVCSKYGEKSWLENSDEIMSQPADVYVPAALGADINDDTIPVLVKAGVKIVAGCANNQLAHIDHGQALKENNILYAPDYVINAGGVISAGLQYDWTRFMNEDEFPTHEDIKSRVSDIYDTLLTMFRRSDLENTSTALVADEMAWEGFCTKKLSEEPEALLSVGT